jgi:hypothetical protein
MPPSNAVAVRIMVVALLAVLPVAAQAAWFCDSIGKEFAAERTSQALRGVFIYYDRIIARGDPAEAKEQVDAYKARVVEMKAWAEALSDSCLRDAYLSDLKIHERIIDRDYLAIEFLETPKPFQPNS